MDLGHPVRAVVPSLDGPVLTVLAGLATPVSGREVARLVGTASPAGVQRVLTRLVGEGVVTVERRRNAAYYSVNRNHLAWPAVEILAGLRRELLRRIEERIGSWAVPVETAAVYGSLARGEGSVDSDVDLLLVRADEVTGERALAWDDQVDSLVTAVQSWSGNPAQPYDISVSDLRAHVGADEPIVRSWRREAITLVGRDLSVLLRSVAR